MVIKCDICSKEFLQNIQLKIHKRLHSDLKNMASVIAPEEAATLNAVELLIDNDAHDEVDRLSVECIEPEGSRKVKPDCEDSQDSKELGNKTSVTSADTIRLATPTSVSETSRNTKSSNALTGSETAITGSLGSTQSSLYQHRIGSCHEKPKEPGIARMNAVKPTDSSKNITSLTVPAATIPPPKLTCPYPNCRLQIDEAELTHHLASKHNLHLCISCGEVKNSAAALEDHRNSEKCRSVPDVAIVGNSVSEDSSAPTVDYNAGNSASCSKANENGSSTESKQSLANGKASTGPLSGNVIMEKSTPVKRGRPSNRSLKERSLVVPETTINGAIRVHKNTRKKRDESFTSASSSQESLNSHPEASNEGEGPACGIKLPDKEGATLAVNMQHESLRKFGIHDYYCDKCQQGFSRHASLRNHIRTCHNKESKEHVCEDCGEDFTTEDEKNLHWDQEHDKLKNSRGSPAQGTRCRRKRISSCDNSLDDDYPATKKRVTFTVESAAVESSTKLTAEVLTPQPTPTPQNSGALPQASLIKCITMTSAAPLPTNIQSATVPVYHLPKPTKCNFCNSVFADRMDLAVHLLDHNAAKDAEKKDNHSQQLNELIIGTKLVGEIKSDKLHKCVVCGGGFKNRFDMVAHLKAEHDKKGTYPCIDCPQVFSEAIELLNHTTDKHFNDTSVAYLATSTINPTKPIVTSNNAQSDKKFPCTVCASTFDTLPDLHKHHRQNHPERPWFVCTQEGCHVPYATEKSLNRHLQQEHNLGPNRRRYNGVQQRCKRYLGSDPPTGLNGALDFS